MANRPPGAGFDAAADRYDAWFDSPEGSRIFGLELACLRNLIADAGRPWLEVGVGTGRFAQALGVEHGVDPSTAMLSKAAARGICVSEGAAEQLPYADATFGAVLMMVAICFLDNPRAALAESARVLRPRGLLVAGIIPADSPWGLEYRRKGREGHEFYSHAHFYRTGEILSLAQSSGFQLQDAFSCLKTGPGEPITEDAPKPGVMPGFGFVALSFRAGDRTR
jgi:ubiquinone/menaquinone biosynthesis C-methylase UbiE